MIKLSILLTLSKHCSVLLNLLSFSAFRPQAFLIAQICCYVMMTSQVDRKKYQNSFKDIYNKVNSMHIKIKSNLPLTDLPDSSLQSLPLVEDYKHTFVDLVP